MSQIEGMKRAKVINLALDDNLRPSDRVSYREPDVYPPNDDGRWRHDPVRGQPTLQDGVQFLLPTTAAYWEWLEKERKVWREFCEERGIIHWEDKNK